ncbi:RNA polymerase sigma factor [Ferrimicrobium sp.]|uniref:RNA polymerase sigma factor n=1 Tax=Ferrimicrobium sp. TaxID=2926050 RepID=UPI002629CD56|nr:RNA polymerase sigma factor [Ferrimicrobium sp.]
MKIATEEEFRSFFEENLDRIVNYAFSIVQNRQEAEDIAVEALARAYASWSRIDGTAHRRAWVFRTTLNLGIDQLRKRKRSKTTPGINGALEDNPMRFQPITSDATGDLATNRAELIMALRRLPERQREAVTLHYLGGFGVAEVAELMGIGTETVKTHLARGMKVLRTEFGVEDQGEQP